MGDVGGFRNLDHISENQNDDVKEDRGRRSGLKGINK